jgi:uncharacterized protein YwqG
MKYVKHFTWKEWKKFNNHVQPDNSFTFINYSTGKKESYDSLTMQEVLLSKYKIILDEYEPKWTRRYHSITKIVNQKNLDQSITKFNGMVNAFSGGMNNGKAQTKKDKANHDTLFGKSKSKSSESLWGKSKSVNIWGDKPRKTRTKKSKKSNSLNIWNDDKKTPLF